MLALDSPVQVLKSIARCCCCCYGMLFMPLMSVSPLVVFFLSTCVRHNLSRKWGESHQLDERLHRAGKPPTFKLQT